MSAAKSKPPRLRIKITRRRIIAAALLLLGLFLALESTRVDSALVTTLTFESTSLGETPTVGVLARADERLALVCGIVVCGNGRDEFGQPPSVAPSRRGEAKRA